MKLNFQYPATGAQKLFDIEDEHKVRFLYDKRMGQEVPMDSLGEEWKGYICRISGGNDKQGFPMKQGILTVGRVRLLMGKGHSCYRPRRTGERKRKSVHGCIIDGSLSVLSLVVTKKGDGEVPGLTDRTVPRRLGPKRAGHIRKLFNLTKADDVRQYVVRRPLKEKEGKKLKTKAPKIQRLITPRRLQRKRFRVSLKKKRAEKSKTEAAEDAKLLAMRAREEKERKEEAKRRRSSASKSGSAHGSGTPTPSVSEPVVSKKKSGKVPAQAPEVAAQLAARKAEQPAASSKSSAAAKGKGPQPAAAKGKEVAKGVGEVPGKGGVAGKKGSGAPGGQKEAPPAGKAEKRKPEEKAAEAKTAPKKPAAEAKPAAKKK